MDSERAVYQGHSRVNAPGTLLADGLARGIQGVLFPDVEEGPVAAPNGVRLPVMGRSPAIQKLLEAVLKVAPTDAWILLSGESGTGKGFIANLIHQCSARSSRPFIEVICGGLVETLLESEFFGHERGAFTGASDTKPGRFELAADGTIFLDEIGDLALSMQGKLLRVLQDRKFERVGGTSTLTSRARVIAATNRDLRALVAKGQFREDLFYRLNVVSIHVPSLRTRKEDIPALVGEFLGEFGMRHRGSVPEIHPEALEKLSAYSWPGNVRDLRNCIESLVVLARGGSICAKDLPPQLEAIDPLATDPAGALGAEREALLLALLESNGNRTGAASRMSMSRRHFHRLLRKHHL